MKPKIDINGNAVKRNAGLDAVYEGEHDINASQSASTSNITASRIKISKKTFKESRTTVGWRINSSTVDIIKELAFESRMGINEFVQELLDKALKDVDIE